MMDVKHIPVLLNEVIKVLDPKVGEFFIDGTLGGGGHTDLILEKIGRSGIFLGIDLDGNVLEKTKEKIKSNFEFQISNFKFEYGNYTEIPEILKREKLPKADGLLLDLGFSSFQIDDPKRGFSFLHDAPLDMRYDIRSKNISAEDVINGMNEKDLADIFWKYGEERWSRVIAKKIIDERKKKKIHTTIELAHIIEKAISRKGRVHPATKVFQALRIYVNKELENIETITREIPNIIAKNGRVAIISFHSLEDRIVKNAFRDLVKSKKAVFINKKPIIPTRAEVLKNPRSRSAKLRAIQII
ncbi:MAG: 16S rRNA (cytosine(1402)-N(4))-methyltransferase RsmH [Patescibacteria group bacterium]